MSTINKNAVLNPFTDLNANILDYVPRATTTKFGIVAIGSGINVDNLGRIYLDTQEYSDRLTAIEEHAASTLTTQKSEVATAIAQVNQKQSQTISTLTAEVNTLKTNLTNSITTTRNELITRANQLAQDVTDITQQLTQDKAAVTQEIQDALNYLKDTASVASSLRTARTFTWTGDATGSLTFNGTSNVATPLVLANSGVTVGTYKSVTVDAKGRVTAGSEVTNGLVTATANTIAANEVTTNTNTFLNITEKVSNNAASVKASTQITGVGSVTVSSDTAGKLTITGSQSITGNAATASKLQTSRTISLTGGVIGSVNFDGSANTSIATTITGLGVANGIATLDSSGQVPSTQLPSYVDDVLEYVNVAAFPTPGVAGKIYVETTGNTTYRWSGSGYTKITSGEVSAVAGKTGVVTLTKADVGLPNVDNTADSSKNVASAAKLTTARTLTVGRTGKTFDGSANIAWTATEVLPTATSGQFLKFDGTNWVAAADNNTTYSAISQAEATTGTATQDRLISASVLKNAIQTHAPTPTNISGNAATATKLQTARSIAISGAVTGTATSFDGTADIAIETTAIDGSKISTGTIPAARIPTLNQDTTGNAATATKLQTARTLTIADSGKLVDGSGNVSWTRLDMGVPQMTTATNVGTDNSESCIGYVTNSLFGQPDGALYSHVYSGIWKHQIQGDYRTGQIAIRGKNNGTWQAWRTVLDSGNFNNYSVPLTGGTMTGNLNVNALGVSNSSNTSGLGISLYGGANGGMPSYGLAFSGTATFGTHGSVAGDWATYFTMSGATNRGWIFKSGNEAGGNVASISAAGAITVTSVLSSGNITAFSDARLKDNITKIPDALNKLNQLKGVTYTRKDIESDKKYAGLIAQDVQKVLPEAVAINEDEIISVDYNGVIGLLVEAVKELSDRIEMLEG